MTFVLALCEIDFVASWRVVFYGMSSNSDFAYLKSVYGVENLAFTSDAKLANSLSISEVDYED